MKKLFSFILLVVPFFASAQLQSLDTIKAPSNYDNIYSRTIASDSLSSSFVIFIKKEVKKHKHATHTENVYILDGEGEMLCGFGDVDQGAQRFVLVFLWRHRDRPVACVTRNRQQRGDEAHVG